MMNGRTHVRRSASRHPGFTLVEMLIAITIIGLLAAMVLGGLNAARETAKIDKTKTLITKLHYIIMGKYDSYRTRRVSMDLANYVKTSGYYDDLNEGWTKKLARARVNALRDLMRREMPDRWSDLWWQGPSTRVLLDQPALFQRYRQVYNDATSAAGTDTAKQQAIAENAAAECLYMIVMNIPEAAEQFHASEIGDVDNDGLREFIDAWGRPIRFIRWPTGFFQDVSADYHGDSDLQFGPRTLPSGAQNLDYQADPFDQRGVLSPSQGGFASFPLIYSAGPDGEFDINIGKKDKGTTVQPYSLDSDGNIDPFADDGDGHSIGRPLDNENSDDFTDLRHYDNIHNHRLETGRGG